MMRVVITCPDCYEGESEAIVDMLNNGIDRVHIRKPSASSEQIAQLLAGIPTQYRKQLSLHDGVELAIPYGVGGVHLNSRNYQMPTGFTGLVSRSCHSVDELMENTGLDYLFLSPVYPSISKSGYSNDGLLEQFVEAQTNHLQLPPVIALGGVRPYKMSELQQAGFTGLAMLGAAWRPVEMQNFRLQFITPSGTDDQIVESVTDAIAGGCRWVQLRMKDARSREILDVARRIEPICHNVGATFLLDDRVDLVALAKADGVHLGKNDMSISSARRVLGPGYIVGGTANDFFDIKDAVTNGADYIGLGPYRFTTTKKKLSPVLGIEGYRNILRLCRESGINIPVVAIGGLDQEDFIELCDAGVAGFAISGSIATASARVKKTNEIINQLHNLPWIN